MDGWIFCDSDKDFLYFRRYSLLFFIYQINGPLKVYCKYSHARSLFPIHCSVNGSVSPYCPQIRSCTPSFTIRRICAVVVCAAHPLRPALTGLFTARTAGRLRNGVETIPANIRKNYHLDKLPRGKQRGKFFFGSKIAALNFRKLFGFRKGLGNYAQNPMLT